MADSEIPERLSLSQALTQRRERGRCCRWQLQFAHMGQGVMSHACTQPFSSFRVETNMARWLTIEPTLVPYTGEGEKVKVFDRNLETEGATGFAGCRSTRLPEGVLEVPLNREAVHEERLELSRPKARLPKSRVSAIPPLVLTPSYTPAFRRKST